ncbi:MAG TPA: uL15 family ribosomal protein [Candidatus Nitrosopolaris sp.]|nr:uL15 family ribosomal protein [Candidatus Nitrosopolaris sp.]
MATRLRKSRRQRGTRYCGWGQIGQHRQSGSRGGVGAAGKHKHFWIRTVIEEPSHFGHDSFYLINREHVRKWLNVRDLDGILARHGSVRDTDTKPTLDLTSLGYHKLLGGGKVSGGGVKVRIEKISHNAKQKIEEVGGEVLLSNEHNTK